MEPGHWMPPGGWAPPTEPQFREAAVRLDGPLPARGPAAAVSPEPELAPTAATGQLPAAPGEEADEVHALQDALDGAMVLVAKIKRRLEEEQVPGVMDQTKRRAIDEKASLLMRVHRLLQTGMMEDTSDADAAPMEVEPDEMSWDRDSEGGRRSAARSQSSASGSAEVQ